MVDETVICRDCQHCSGDYLMLPTGTYRYAVCQRDIVTPVIVDAGAWRECPAYLRCPAS